MYGKMAGKDKIFPVFYYLAFVQHTKHSVSHPLSLLFNLIKLPAQFLYFVVIREQEQATFRGLHGNARADLGRERSRNAAFLY